jgi:uncharacterized Zn-finger protein
MNIEEVIVNTAQIQCDGTSPNQTDASLGHPTIYLHINPKLQHIDCPYCGLRFVLNK